MSTADWVRVNWPRTFVAAAGDRHRVVIENDHFVCFVPFAALSPFMLWIVPKAAQAHLSDISSDILLTSPPTYCAEYSAL